MAKSLTADQLQVRKDKAVRFIRDVLGDADRAGEVEDESLEDYADRRKIAIINPKRSNYDMANGGGNSGNATKADLLQQIDDLQQENQDLQDALDSIADIASPPEEEEEEDEDDDGSD